MAAAVGRRWVHLLRGLASGTAFTTGVPRAVVDSLAAGLLAVGLFALAAVEAFVTLPLARALT